MVREIKQIIVHVSASSSVEGWYLANAGIIRRFHKEVRGWNDIGYHYVIHDGRPNDPKKYDETWDGKLEAGRDLETMGAHAKGHNADSVGICLIGEGDGKFTPLQLAALEELLDWLRGTYNLPAGAVIGHRDVDTQGKTCPGFDVRQWMQKRSAA